MQAYSTLSLLPIIISSMILFLVTEEVFTLRVLKDDGKRTIDQGMNFFNNILKEAIMDISDCLDHASFISCLW